MASNEDVQVFMSLFKGRGDIYAKRWEKNGKSGYGPDYKVDWQEYNVFKSKGGTFASFPNKHPLPLTWEVVNKHLDGIHTIGIYPLLQDNTSYFIVADFDGDNWQEECKDFIKICKKFKIPVSLERSRSGKGGHVWIFFEENYTAYKSRKIVLELIRQVLKLSQFDKEVSFDRLFPNQDYHSNLGVGNLIALPLQKEPSKDGNSVFLDLKTFDVIPNQLGYLKTIEKISTEKLDKLFSEFSSEVIVFSETEKELYKLSKNDKKLSIILSNQIYINKNELSSKLVNFLKEKLNFLNKEYLIKKKVGISTYKVEKYFRQIEETDSHVLIPRGFKDELFNFFKENNIVFSIKDERLKLSEVKYKSKIKLHDHQKKAIQNIGDIESGVIVAPAGSGKTIIGLELIVKHKKPTLILVHRKQLADQWIERIESFLGIPKTKVGQLTGQKKKVGNKITVAMVQSLTRLNEADLSNLTSKFGMIIVDECHHLPAKSFRNIISKFKSFYIYGLTATPKRKYNDEELIYNYLGSVIATVDSNYQNDALSQKSLTTINLVKTQISVPFDFQTDQFETLSRILIFDTTRNLLIIQNILKEIQVNRKILVLTERKEHVEVLNLYLKNQAEVITLIGDDSVAKRKVKIEQITAGNYQILITTGQMFGEGMDFKEFNCLFLVYPFSFEGKLIQYLGRIQRTDGAKTIYDYRDINIPFFDKFFKNRLRYYKKLSNTKIIGI